MWDWRKSASGLTSPGPPVGYWAAPVAACMLNCHLSPAMPSGLPCGRDRSILTPNRATGWRGHAMSPVDITQFAPTQPPVANSQPGHAVSPWRPRHSAGKYVARPAARRRAVDRPGGSGEANEPVCRLHARNPKPARQEAELHSPSRPGGALKQSRRVPPVAKSSRGDSPHTSCVHLRPWWGKHYFCWSKARAPKSPLATSTAARCALVAARPCGGYVSPPARSDRQWRLPGCRRPRAPTNSPG